MNIKDMINALPKGGHVRREPGAVLETVWGEKLDTNHVLEQYPRPQMQRENYDILNGYWRYAITASGKYPEEFDGLILVPFSPESPLSGVKRHLKPCEYLWYERTIDIENHVPGTCRILHFEAVDQCAMVYINGHFAGKHVGGYLPFEIDLTPWLVPGKNHLRLTVRVQDFSDTSYHSRGKQKLSPSGMYYTAQSGIWQTVWMETVPKRHISMLHLEPDYDRHQVTLIVREKNKSVSPMVRVRIYPPCIAGPDGIFHNIHQQTPIIDREFGSLKITLDIPAPKCWQPDAPYLYPAVITSGTDVVYSYFAMRSFSIEHDDHGIPRICLNHEPIFLNGVLDQGYWPDGLYTAPSDEALIYDIHKAQQLGFNMIRKHAKIECRRWYYHCDRLGMIVWQDMVNGGDHYMPAVLTYLPTLLCVPGPKKRSTPSVPERFLSRVFDRKMPGLTPNGKLEYILTGRTDPRGRHEFLRECAQTLLLLRQFPSIMTWIPFNEGWGQFDTELVTELIKSADPGRLIDSASGWFDHKTGDFKSVHNYFRKLSAVPDARAYVLSEYGGYVYQVRRHSMRSEAYGYHTFHACEEFEKAFVRLLLKDIQPLIRQGLCAAVYTQLTDIEEETNGLLTYDRRVCKISRQAAAKVKKAMQAAAKAGKIEPPIG